MPKSSAVVKPNLGLFLSESPLSVRDRALSDGYNFRILDGELSNLNLGWTPLGSPQVRLNGPVVYMDFFFVDGVNERNVWLTNTDAYSYNSSDDSIVYITPTYATGTAAASGTAVTGTGTAWNTNDAMGVKNAKAGDFISFGSATQNSTTATWYEIDSVGSDTGIVLTSSAGTVVDGPYTIRRCFTGDVTDRWVADVFVRPGGSGEDTWYATNGVDPVIKWDGVTATALYVDTSAVFSRCLCLRVYSNMMVYGGVTVSGEFYPASIINSNVGNPEDFTGLSEQFQVFSGSNPILQMVPIGDNLAIYSRRNVTLAQFVGDPLVFTFRQTVSDIGPPCGGLIADLGDFHEFVGPDGQYYFDGVQVRTLGAQVWRSILLQRDPVRTEVGFIHFNEEWGDLMWFLPQTSDSGAGSATAQIETAIVEHYLEEVGDKEEAPYSRRRAPFTAAGYTEQRGGQTFADLTDPFTEYNFRFNDGFFFLAFPISIMGDNDGYVWKLNTAQTANGAALPSFVRFGRRALGDGRIRGVLKRVYPFCQEYSNAMDVHVRLYDSAGRVDPDSIGDFSFSQLQGEEGHFCTVFRRGRFFELEFGSAAGEPWTLSGYDIDVVSGGRR